MTRENMFSATDRESWVTDVIERDLKQVAKGGELSCAQAMEFAKNHKVPLRKMKYLTDFFKIKVKSCQLGCF
jgi:hypothetical protein